MSKRLQKKDVPPPQRGRARVMVLVGLAALLVAGGAIWWLRAGPDEAAGGAPRLAVDRTEVDLGYRRFDTAARVVFTLTNAGDGPLRLAEIPRVKAVQGC